MGCYLHDAGNFSVSLETWYIDVMKASIFLFSLKFTQDELGKDNRDKGWIGLILVNELIKKY